MIQSRLLPEETLQGRRQLNKGKYGEDGFPLEPTFDEFEFVCNVQPISGLEILQVPEGDRTRQVFNCWTEFKLGSNDIVTRESEEYEVRPVEDWTQQSLSHYKVRLVKRDVQEK